jgi:hypothetical protein
MTGKVESDGVHTVHCGKDRAIQKLTNERLVAVLKLLIGLMSGPWSPGSFLD